MIGRCTVCLFMCLRNHLSGKRLLCTKQIYYNSLYTSKHSTIIYRFALYYWDGCYVVYHKKIILELNIFFFTKLLNLL